MQTTSEAVFQFSPSLNTHFLNELFRGDFSYAITVFESVKEELPVYWQELEEGFANQSTSQIKTAAHKCKTLFAYVGITAVQQKLEELEQLCTEQKSIVDFEKQRQELNRLREGATTVIEEEIKRLKLYYEN